MDTPQRWQVGSVATAIAGLSIGALLLGRPSTEPVAPIELVSLEGAVPITPVQDDPADASESEPSVDDLASTGPEIVEPERRDAGPDPVDPPLGPAADRSSTSDGSSVDGTTPSSPSRSTTADTGSPDSPPSVDSPSSADSD